MTRLNRDITAPKIKQYLNLNVSTHTILRTSKQFEWNQNNSNSYKPKKADSIGRRQHLTTQRHERLDVIDSTGISLPVSSSSYSLDKNYKGKIFWFINKL